MKSLKPFYRINPDERAIRTQFTPVEIANLYGFPQNATGKNQTIGIIQLGGGYILSDLTTYLQNLGITKVPNIVDVNVGSGFNNPSDTYASFEVYLDLEIIAAIAPESNIKIYFAQNSINAFYQAINTAINDNCNIISISWGISENYLSFNVLTSYNNLFKTAYDRNITIFCASGDRGSSDGTNSTNVNFPSSSPYVVSCGGTTLSVENNTILSEITWNNDSKTSATGGGMSRVFNKPSYQNQVPLLMNVFKRSSPDIAGNADPRTGYRIYIDGKYYTVGGTSAVAPLWSGLLALIKEKSTVPQNIPFQDKIYTTYLTQLFTDITQGNNGPNGIYDAKIGYDMCTGWGSPNMNIINCLTYNTYTFFGTTLLSPQVVKFTDLSTNNPTNWLWNFGDGNTSTEQNPTYTYSGVGTYNVSLITTILQNNTTISSNFNKKITLLPQQRPQANFTSRTITFKDTSVNNPISWLWNFGDGNTSTEQNPTYTYLNAGSYNVTLRASNSSGTTLIAKRISIL